MSINLSATDYYSCKNLNDKEVPKISSVIEAL